MIDGSEKHNCQLDFELQNSHVWEKRSNELNLKLGRIENQSTQWKTLQSGWENQQQQELNPNHIAGRQG